LERGAGRGAQAGRRVARREGGDVKKKTSPRPGLDYHRTIRAPSAKERLATFSESLRTRREARERARAEYLARPVVPPTAADLGIPADPLRPESVAAVRARRIPNVPIAVALADAVNGQSFHGAQLMMLVGDSYLAESAIRLAIRVGWIKRGNFDPSREQRVFGAGGLDGKALLKVGAEHHPPLCFHYLTMTTKWLEVDHVQQMLVGGGVL
jgi:hypothetical protein